MAAYKGGNYAGAEQLFRHALATAPPDKLDTQAKLHFDLARSLQRQGKNDDAVREYNAYLHVWPQAEDAEDVKKQIKQLGGEVRDLAPEAERKSQRAFDTGTSLYAGDLHNQACMNAAMQARVTPALKTRMQGKTCFNFKAVDEAVFAELEILTRAAAAAFATPMKL